MRNLFAKAARLKALRGLRANLGRTMLSVGAAALVALSAWESREIMAVNRARGSSAQPSSGAETGAPKPDVPGLGPCYSAPTWAPFSATERFMNSTNRTSPAPKAAHSQKMSK